MNTNHMTTIQHLMSEHCYGSISNRSAQPEENTAQEKYLTRLPGYNNTDQLCDRESQLTDLSESWPHRELLHNRPKLINQGYKIIPMAHKEVYLLSGPSELQPVDDGVTQYTPKGKDQDLLQPPDASEAQRRSSNQDKNTADSQKKKKLTPSTDNDDRNFVRHNSVEKFSPDLVHLTKSDTSSVSDSIFFRRKGGNCRRCSCTCRRHTCTCIHTGDSRGMTTLHSKIKKVNEKELWEASQRI